MRPVYVYKGIAAALMLIAGALSVAQAHAQERAENAESFSGSVVQQLMGSVRDGLVAHDPDKMLSAFGGMHDYSEFAGQVRTFFSLYENFRVYYRIVDVAAVECADKSKARGRAVIEMQLQGDDAHNEVPGVTRNGQLHVEFERFPNGWRISDINPREFFR